MALSDPPYEDSAALITQLYGLGVRTVMVTGDSPVTARVVADAVEITGRSVRVYHSLMKSAPKSLASSPSIAPG